MPEHPIHTGHTADPSRPAPMRRLAPTMLACLLAHGAWTCAHATAIQVDTLPADSSVGVSPDDAGDGLCSLREAMIAANNNAPYHDCALHDDGGSGITVVLPTDAVFTLVDGPYDADGANGLPDVTDSFAIEGNHAVVQRIDDAHTPQFRLLHVAASGNLALRRITLRGGHAMDGEPDASVPGPHDGEDGGGIYNRGILALSGSTVGGNRSGDGGNSHPLQGSGGDGGGICNLGQLTVDDSSISGNRTGNAAVIDESGAVGVGGEGGGIYNHGAIEVTNSTINANATGFASLGLWQGSGAGIAHQGGTLRLTRSSIVDNNGNSGGLYSSSSDSEILVANSTIANNVSADDNNVASGVYVDGLAKARLSYVTVTGNQGDALNANNAANRIRLDHSLIAAVSGRQACGGSGHFDSEGYNLTTDGTCTLSGSGDRIAADPGLGPLGDNGGPTPTIMPQPGSPAIDATPAIDCSTNVPAVVNIAQDQRGMLRYQGDGCDIGAVEAPSPATSLIGLGGFDQHAMAGNPFDYPLVVQARSALGQAVADIPVTPLIPASGAGAACDSAITDSAGIAAIHCTANMVAGSYQVGLTITGEDGASLRVDFTLTNEPDDHIFVDGFDGTSSTTVVLSPTTRSADLAVPMPAAPSAWPQGRIVPLLIAIDRQGRRVAEVQARREGDSLLLRSIGHDAHGRPLGFGMWQPAPGAHPRLHIARHPDGTSASLRKGGTR